MKIIVYFCFFCATALNLQADSAKLIVTEIATAAGIQIDGTKPWDIQVHNSDFYGRVLKDGSLGLGESYMEGWWDADRVDETIYHMLRANIENRIRPTWKQWFLYLKTRLLNRQSRSGSMNVINNHYQLGNDLYQNMLDSLMTYSCGYWKNAKTLDEAQEAKYDLIARKLGFKQGMRVLDIGCGWGGFAKYVATKYGVQVVGITLSENQAEYARKVCANLPVEIRVQDYRDINEKFDRVVEIGMFEHVGQKNYRSFMEIVYNALNPGGMFMLHTIGSNHSALNIDLWLEKYIFSGGQLPSIAQIGKSIEGLFVMEDWHNFSADYDKTLMAWFRNFDTNWHKFQGSYPPYFYRMWKYYLLSCAGGFRARYNQLWQVVLSKGGTLGGYDSLR